MNYLLLCFSYTLSVYFPQTHAWSSETDDAQPVDDFIDKLLKSDKFDELASKIAEKAVDRIVKMQRINVTKPEKSELVYRVNKNVSDDFGKQPSNNSDFLSEEIISLFDKNSPFNKLTLKYAKLIEKKRGEQNVKNDKSTKKVRAKPNRARDIKSDREKNIHGKRYTKDDTRVREKVKLKRFKKIPKPKRTRKTTTTKVTRDDSSIEKHYKQNTFESDEPILNTTAVLHSGEEKYYTHIFAQSEEKATTKKSRIKSNINAKHDNMTNVKTKRILARENERFYVFASSSDYENLYIEDFNR